MRALVVGAGALGSVFAARLALAGVDVVALDNNLDHVRACRDVGLVVGLPDGTELSTRLEAVGDMAELTGTFDFALITLKAPKLPEVLEGLGRACDIDTFVSLGNGLVQDVIADIVGPDRMLVGTCSFGATFVGPGHVLQTTLAPLSVGDPSGRLGARLTALVSLLENVAPTHATDRITGQVWSKLLLNSSLSGLGTVVGGVYSDVVADSRGRRLVLGVWTEGYDVATALGVELDEVAGVDPVALTVRDGEPSVAAEAVLEELVSRIGATKASMLQDVERGVPTEVGVINGGVAAAGRRSGVATPLNDAIVEIVHELEAGTARPSFEHLSRLSALDRRPPPGAR